MTYAFKTSEDIDAKNRTIVKETPVPATTQKVEFTLEQKEKELAHMQESLAEYQKIVDKLTSEIAEIKTALNIK